MPPSGPIDHLVTSGTFSLDGGTWDVDNNVWLVGDDNEVLVIDAAHDADAIAEAVGGRRLVAVVCTHAHDDHVNAAPALADRFNAPILLHPADAPLWEMTHPNRAPDRELADGDVLTAGGIELRVLHTPGPLARLDLPLRPRAEHRVHRRHPVQGGPGATGRSFSSFETIIASIRDRLLTLPGDTGTHRARRPTTIGGRGAAPGGVDRRGH